MLVELVAVKNVVQAHVKWLDWLTMHNFGVWHDKYLVVFQYFLFHNVILGNDQSGSSPLCPITPHRGWILLIRYGSFIAVRLLRRASVSIGTLALVHSHIWSEHLKIFGLLIRYQHRHLRQRRRTHSRVNRLVMTSLLPFSLGRILRVFPSWRTSRRSGEVYICFIVLAVRLLHYFVKAWLIVLLIFFLELLTQLSKPVSILLYHQVLVLDLFFFQQLPLSLSVKFVDIIICYWFIFLLLIFETLLFIFAKELLEVSDVFSGHASFLVWDGAESFMNLDHICSIKIKK